MKVSNIVISVPLLSPNDTIGTALTVMHAKNVDIAPVADRQQRSCRRRDPE